MRYQFKTASGQLCCESDDIKLLCPHCRAAADELAHEYSPPSAYKLPAPVEVVLDAHGVPHSYGLRRKERR